MIEIRHHDDRTGKHHKQHLWEVQDDEEDDQVAGTEEELENNDGDLAALVATAQEEETKALVGILGHSKQNTP